MCSRSWPGDTPIEVPRRARNPQYKRGSDQRSSARGFRAAVSVTYTAVLDVSEDSVLFLSGLLHAERIRRGTREDTRALSTFKQAVLALRWLFDDTRMSQLARDNGVGVSTAYAYRDEAIA